MKCLIHTTHSFSLAGCVACIFVAEGIGVVWVGVAGLAAVATATRWSGLMLMCSFRASMEASLTRAVRSAPLKGEGGGKKAIRIFNWIHTHWQNQSNKV